MQRLACHVQQYAWGKIGSDSEVSLLRGAADADFHINENEPYSELWVGTHPSGPSRIHGSSQSLSNYIAKTESAKSLCEKFTDLEMDDIHLPYMMKVMSIRVSLSLQVHPSKAQAAEIHKIDPVHYPDTNHKPELALALSKFETLCGFQPAKELLNFMKHVTEFKNLIGEDNVAIFEAAVSNGSTDSDEARKALKACFVTVMYLDGATVARNVRSLVQRLNAGELKSTVDESLTELILRLHGDFAEDVGVFSPFFLNHLKLEPGECCYYDPGELHAYLCGECIECVSNSNNTIRGALTQKHKDLDILCELLSYRMAAPQFYMLPPVKIDELGHVTLFDPPTPDYKLHEIKFAKAGAYTLPTLPVNSTMVVLQGSATEANVAAGERARKFRRGDVLFVPADIKVTLAVDAPLVAYRAFSFLADEPTPEPPDNVTFKIGAN